MEQKTNYENISENYLEMAGNAINRNYYYHYVRLGRLRNLFCEVSIKTYQDYRYRNFCFGKPGCSYKR